jgi:glucose/arabinose dehydrogenase
MISPSAYPAPRRIKARVETERFSGVRAILFTIIASTILAGQAHAAGIEGFAGGAYPAAQVPFREEEVLRGRTVPWAIVFAPDGSMFFTERQGRLFLFKDGALTQILLPGADVVFTAGETGLMDLKLAPQFDTNRLLYLAYVYRRPNGSLAVRVVRYKVVFGGPRQELTERKVIVEGIPASQRHCGTRLSFGPDGMLYVTTGDAAQRDLAQRLNSLAGKTLRLNPDGTVPPDNPFSGQPGARREVWSLGHRNAQGLDWQPGTNLMFQTEHGPSGDDGPGGGDEVNIVEAGKNYGWPVIHHTQTSAGMESPLLEYTNPMPPLAVAPASGTFYRGTAFTQYRGNFLFGCLVGGRIIRVVLDGRRVVSQERLPLQGRYGRIREVAEGPDGSIYFSTSNCDGRGTCHQNIKDRIIRLVPSVRATSPAYAERPTPQPQQGEFSLPLEERKKLEVSDAPKASSSDLVNVFTTLLGTGRHNLGSLTRAERRRLLEREPGRGLREKIGIMRPVRPPIRVSNLTKAQARGRPSASYAGGRIDAPGDGWLVWTTEIFSPGATGLRVEIRDAVLPPGCKVFVTDGRAQVHGPYSLTNEPFLANTVFGPRVYVQMQIPAEAAELASNGLAIYEIAHIEDRGEGSAGAPGLGSGRRGGAHVAVSCGLKEFCRPDAPEDALLETASLGVARINFRAGTSIFQCSGGLLRDSTDSGTPFFLTANHCFASQAIASTLEAHWRYRKVCGQSLPGLGSFPVTRGSTLVATSPATDFTLVQLSQRPPAGSHFFNWSHRDISDVESTVYRVHHPFGRPQHRQRSLVRPVRPCDEWPTKHALFSSPQDGGTNNGSSGSLVFRANGTTPEVVGQLYGGCFRSVPACGYWNVDGAFAQTYLKVRQYLDGAPTPPGEGPEVAFQQPADGASLPGNTTVEIVAEIKDGDGVARAELYWKRSNAFFPCDGLAHPDWRCDRQGDRYVWRISVGTGDRQFYINATDSRENRTVTPARIVHLQ